MGEVLEIPYQIKNDCAVFYLKGDIDLFVAEKIKKFLFQILKENDFKKIILNFKKVEFVDSSGIAFLVQIQNTIKNERAFRLCCMSEGIYRVFEYTNLDHFFLIDTTEEDSIKNMA